MIKFTNEQWKLSEDNMGCKDIVTDKLSAEHDALLCYSTGLADEDEDMGNICLTIGSPQMYKALLNILYGDVELGKQQGHEVIQRIEKLYNEHYDRVLREHYDHVLGGK